MNTVEADVNRKSTRVDPVTASIIQGSLENIAIEMGYKLMRMSYSSIIRESEDFGAALVDATGRGLAEAVDPLSKCDPSIQSRTGGEFEHGDD